MYVKLWSDILDSSVWLEQPAEIRLVWITLLAMADQDGMVRATSKAIARRAIVPEPVALEALELFQKPDDESRNPDNEGRRIEKVPGGYSILRYVELRDMKTRAEQREATRKRVARWRAANPSTNVTPPVTNVTNVTYSDADADADTEADKERLSSKPPVSTCPYREIVKAWNERATSLGLAAIRGLSDGRKRKLAARWKEWPDGLETFAALLTAIGESAFLRGQGGKEWRATFDWLVKNDENWQKVLEGQYDGKGEEAIPRPPTRFGPYWDDENRRYFQDSNGKREYAET